MGKDQKKKATLAAAPKVTPTKKEALKNPDTKSAEKEGGQVEPQDYKNYENIIVERKEDGKVEFIQLNRPKALNALCDALFDDLIDALKKADKDADVQVIVLTGSEKAFAAGADIKEMCDKDYATTYGTDMLGWWTQLQKIRKPIIGVVNGFALGGGCELACACDILVAGDNAKFGQPEINLGIIPGMGGTQRLTRAIGKSRSMELCLTGDFMLAEEACSRGLVSKVVPKAESVEEGMKIARKIASKSKPSTMMAKECVNQAYEQNLSQGLQYEKRLFQSLFATNDQKEGMKAFSEKRKANWTHN